MRKATLITAVTLFLISFTAPLSGKQKPQGKQRKVTVAEANVSVTQILDNYLEAIGGREALQRITSRISKGTIEVIGLESKGTIEVYEKAPNKVMHVVQIPGLFKSAEGFNGTLAWSVQPKSGKVLEKHGAELESAKSGSDFYEQLNLRERFPRMTLKGVEKIQYRDEERATYVIEAVRARGNPETFYFDKQNNLLIRHDYTESDEDGEQQVREFLLDYKDVDGVKVPFTTRQAQPEAIFIIRLVEVRQNIAIDDAKFDKPAPRGK